MSEIILATDGSESAEAAARIAIEVAKATGDRLLVVTAWRELKGDFGIPLSPLFPDVADIEREHAHEVAGTAVAAATAAGVEAEAILRHGSPSQEICAVARERKPRLIVIGSQGWSAMERAVFGSVSDSVLHHAPCAVLVVPADEVLARRT